jgi:hypothetical protein
MIMLSDKAKETKNEYMRNYMKKWSKKNPEKVKQINNRYWEKRSQREEEQTETK